MTAPQPKETITPERIAWFAEYYKKHPDWGIFRLSTMTNFYSGVVRFDTDDPDERAALREPASWFNRLTVSQRRRLIQRAEDAANTIVRA